MGDNTNGVTNLHQEINQNMGVTAQTPFAMTNEELAFNNSQQNWTNSRANRRRANIDPIAQQRNTQDWINRTSPGNLGVAAPSLGCNQMIDMKPNMAMSRAPTSGPSGLGTGHFQDMQANLQAVRNNNCVVIQQQNNRASSENLETIKENLKNSQESLKHRSCDDILTIEAVASREQCAIGETLKAETSVTNMTADTNQQYTSPDMNRMDSRDTADSLNESTDDLRQRGRVGSVFDAQMAAIELSNSCRQFYFNHKKNAETIKQAVRSAKHDRAREKMEGKKTHSFDNAMDRLRTEMAELMDQDVSLMCQLLKLNDKIEEMKTISMKKDMYDSKSEMSDTESSDYEESRTDLYNSSLDSSTGSLTLKTLNTLKRMDASPETSPRPEPKLPLTRVLSGDKEIIFYRKKHRKSKKHKKSKESADDTRRSSESSDGNDTSDTECPDSENQSDSDSTLSCNSQQGYLENSAFSDSGSDSDDDDSDNDGADGKDGDDKPPELPPKKLKGGVSQNSRFFQFHKSNGARSFSNLAAPMLTLQGHNISLEKYYVPPGLVYLKHANDESVVCQFTK